MKTLDLVNIGKEELLENIRDVSATYDDATYQKAIQEGFIDDDEPQDNYAERRMPARNGNPSYDIAMRSFIDDDGWAFSINEHSLVECVYNIVRTTEEGEALVKSGKITRTELLNAIRNGDESRIYPLLETAAQKARKAMIICDGAEGFLRSHVKDDDYDDYQIAVERFIKDGSEDNALNLIEVAHELFETAKENVHEEKIEEYVQAQKKRDELHEMIDDIIMMREEQAQREREKIYETKYESYKMPPDILLKIGCEMLPMIYTAKYLYDETKSGNGKAQNIRDAIKGSAMMFDIPAENTIYALTRDENNRPSFISIRKVDNTSFTGDILQKRAFSKILGNGGYAYQLITTTTRAIEKEYGKDGLDKFINGLVNKGSLLYMNKERSKDLFAALHLQLPNKLPLTEGIIRHTAMYKKETAQRKQNKKKDKEMERSR